MSSAAPISDDELVSLFAGLESTPLALAVSGGADSMALMHMAARWAAREEVKAAYRESWESDSDAPNRTRASSALPMPSWIEANWTLDDLRRAGGPPHVVVLTVDHGLRAEAANEAHFVAGEALKIGLPCQILRWEGEKPSSGIQEAAREARRSLLSQAVIDEARAIDYLHRGRDFDLGGFPMRQIVMAHTLEDQAETFLMRLARGSGLDGLSAMSARELMMCAYPGSQIWLGRPLLKLSRVRLIATLEVEGVRWVEDPSNDDDRFERVRVRKMMPLLAELGLSAEKISLSARRLRSAESGLAYWQQFFVMPTLHEMTSPLCAEVKLNPAWLMPGYVGTRTMRYLLTNYGGCASPAELSQLEALVDFALDNCRQPQSGGVTLGGCKIEFVQGQAAPRIRVYREGSGEGLPLVPIAPGQTVDWDGRRFAVEADEHAPDGAVVRALGMQGWADLKRAVPALAGLKWPAAAAATLPVVALDDTVIAHPGIASVLASVKSLPENVRIEWEAFAGRLDASYEAQFGAAFW